MSEVNDTVESTETEPSVDNGTAVDEPTTTEATESAEEKVDREAYEQLQKELNQTKQELNLRRNKEKELEKQKLEETGQYKELADKLQAELDEIRAKEEETSRQKEAEEYRNSILGQYDQDVRDIAEATNLWWDSPENYEEAEQQLRTKLDAIATKLGSKKPKPTEKTEEPSPEIFANNPANDTTELTEVDQLRNMKLEDLRKILPKADPR